MLQFASQAARALAGELGLDDVAIVGTGRGGRVTLADVRAAAPQVPQGLGEPGSSFWLAVLARWELRPDEERLLYAAARTIDEIERLEAALDGASPTVAGSRGQVRAHPLVRELREHRLALKQLLGATGIGLSEAGSGDFGQSRSDAGRKLALIRHGRGRG